MQEDLALNLAGRRVPNVIDRVRRYCGLEWSGGPPGVWAYQYYDVLPSNPDTVEPADVLATAALHPGLSRDDLTFFAARRCELEDWLAEVPYDSRLQDAADPVLAHLDGLLSWTSEVSLGLLTKVLHRKRPGLVPLIDRVVLYWYRPVTGERSAYAAWPKLIRSFWDVEPDGYNVLVAAMASLELAKELGQEAAPTPLRVADIALWMGSQR